MSIDSAISIAWDVLKCVVAPIKRGFGYVMSSESYANNLGEEVKKLEHEADRLHHAMEVARNNLHNVHSRARELQASSENALNEAQDLLGDFERATKTCCYGTLPDPSCRYQFSKKAKHKTEDIKRLAGNCRELHSISYSRPPPGNAAEPTSARREGKDVIRSTTATASASSTSTSIKLRDDGIFESRASVIQEILDALADNRYSVVGVYGMGGVGKSTLLADAKERIMEKNLFDWVAKGDVSENPDIKRIQGEIADALGLSDIKDKDSVSGRAELLRRRLECEEKEKKKVLIMLDNLWKGLDLNSVGIPCGHDNKVIGCKLLLTSRDLNILQTEMGCDRDFHLGVLQEEEARGLFERMVGDNVHDDEFRPLVDEALCKCAGLPLLIVTMAKHLKNATLSRWRDALNQIGRSTNEGISGVINKALQLSYDHLESEDAKSLLQLCAAYDVSEPSIENLVRYGFGWGIFPKDSSMKEARDRLNTLINSLQASSLLLENGGTDAFKIHDLVRDFVAQFVLRDHPLLFLKDKDKVATQLWKERLKSCMAICFPYIDIKELPEKLDCPELRIFLLFTNNKSLEVPDSYFNSMRKLTVLNLTGVCLTCSPTPFQSLENLHTLSLHSCSLEDAAILGELKGLQILSFVNSKIKRLPKEIGQLVELRLLDLNHCSDLQIIEMGVLGRLIKLEELYMENSFNRWNPMEQIQPTNVSLIELNHMKNLCTLHVSIPDPSVLPEDLDVKKLTKYKIQIGNARRWKEDQGSRILDLKLDPISDVLRKGCIQSLLSKIDDLFLAELNGSEQSICALSQEGFPKLKHLWVNNSPSIHHILRWHSLSAFEMLESLILMQLINLTKICSSHVSSSKSFNRLKVIRVISCDKMEVLFPLSLLRGLPQLEVTEVVSCKLMRGIVDDDDDGRVELQNLRVMKLHHLPNIKNFFTAGTAPSSSTSEDQVGTPIAFFNGQKVVFSRLETLRIFGLNNVEVLFFPSILKSLAQLTSLDIRSCKKMKAIIMEEKGLGFKTSETLEFPMLTNLNLHNLKSLMCFSHGKCSRETQSQDCVKSCSTALFNREVAFPNLKTLYITGLNNIEMIWDNQVVAESFTKLKSLCVDECNKLVNIVHSFILRWLLSLERLNVKACGSLEVVFEFWPLKHLDGHHIALPLKELTVSALSKLKCVWDKELHCQAKFQCLHSISVFECESLTSLFPASIAKDLMQLEKLEISECGIVEIIKNEEGLVPKFVFPMLTSLELKFLRELKCLYTGTHTSHWPALKSLMVHGCDKVEILASHLENEMPLDKQPLFLIENGAFPNLQELKLDLSEHMKIWHGHFHDGEFFCKLSLLKLRHLSQESSISTCRFIERLTNLEELAVCESYLEDPSSNEEAIEGTSQEMKVILPFSRYIRHLQTLDVSHCDGLSKMFTSTIAENLVALTKLRISNCRILTEVINDEKGGEGCMVAFNQLKSMELDGLIGLRSFSSAGYTLMFPLLEDIIVTKCPNMKFFSQGPIEASKLKRVQVSKEVWFWAGNLNITIQNMFEEMGTFIGVKKMLLSEFPRLIGKWHNKLGPIKSSWQLKSMVVDKCPLFINAIPSRLMLVLDHLGYLQVRDCELLEEIFDLEGLEVVESTRILPRLRELNLANLPKLRRLWNRDLQESIRFDSLTTLILYNCSNLGHAFTSSMAQCLANLHEMEIKECGQMEKVIVEEEGQGSAVEKITFLKLWHMKLEWLPNLTCFLSTKKSFAGMLQLTNAEH